LRSKNTGIGRLHKLLDRNPNAANLKVPRDVAERVILEMMAAASKVELLRQENLYLKKELEALR